MTTPNKIFEEIKKVNDYGSEYWSARDLARILEYQNYRNFEAVIKKAKESCQKAGQNIYNHFVDADDMVRIGSKATRKIVNTHLSRYACYLIMQNADPSKEIVALGQTYFAIQTRRQEVQDQRLKKKKKSLDFMGSREMIQGEAKANQAHFEVGRKVRQTIKELGGTMPEKLKSPSDIRNIKILKNVL